MRLGERGPRTKGKERHPPKDVILPLLACLVRKWLQIGLSTDMLLIMTSTDDELLKNVYIDALE